MARIIKDMKKGVLLLVFLFSISLVYAADCEIIPENDDCAWNYNTVYYLGLTGEVNSHICVGEVGSACPDEYGYKMCCPDILNNNGGADPGYLSLSTQTNAHAELTGESNYDNYGLLVDGKYTYLEFWFFRDGSFWANWHPSSWSNAIHHTACYYPDAGSSCDAGDVCIIALSDETNAHVADCDYASSYPYLLCCPEAEEETYMKCNQYDQCVEEVGSGSDECTIDADCVHLECDFGNEVCEVVSGPGNDLHDCTFEGESCGGGAYLEITLDSSLCSGSPFEDQTGSSETVDVHVDEDLNDGNGANPSEGAEVNVRFDFDGDELYTLGPFLTMSSGDIAQIGDLFFEPNGNYEITATATKGGFLSDSASCSFIVEDTDGDDDDDPVDDPYDGLVFHRPGECVCNPAHEVGEELPLEECSDGIGDRRVEVWYIDENGDPQPVEGGEGYSWFWNDCFLIVEDIPFMSVSSFVVLAIILMLFYSEIFKRKEHLKNLKER